MNKFDLILIYHLYLLLFHQRILYHQNHHLFHLEIFHHH